MKLRREAGLGIGALVGLQILLSMLAIALLTRMGPAVEKILEDNVFSGAAVEEMLALLARQPAPSAVPEGFIAAWQRAEANVTEDDERGPLTTIKARHVQAFAGEPTARAAVVAALRRLGQVNRDSMRRADARAQRLGQTGAWAAAMLGALALALAIVVYRRLFARVDLPIEQLRRTTQQIRAGNLQARCQVSQSPYEIEQIAIDLNWMLDQWQAASPQPDGAARDARDAAVRAAFAHLLDESPTPTKVIDADGRAVVTGQAALDVDADDPRWQASAVPGTALQIARLGAAYTSSL